MKSRSGTMAAVALLVGASSLFVPAAQAQTATQEQPGMPSSPPASKGDWDVTLGVAVAAQPIYPGAKDYWPWPTPLVSVKYRDLLFLSPDGLGMNVVDWHGLRAGPIIGIGLPRYESWDSHLRGLGDIQPSANAGGFVTYSLGPFEIDGTVRQAIVHTSYGLTGRVALSYRQPLIPGRLEFAIGPEVDLGNDEYDRTWFGVSSSQSARSGLPTYTPGGGATDVGLTANLDYHFSKHILLRSFVGVRQLVGSIADSPIVQTKTQAIIGTGVAYHF